MLQARPASTNGVPAPFLVAPNLSPDGLPRPFAVRSGYTVADYFEFVDVALQQSLGANFLPAASSTVGRLHTVRFTTKTGVLNLGVSACVFCPDENRRPFPEETCSFAETAQTHLFSFERLNGSRRAYELRNRLDDAGGNLPKAVAAVVNMLYREQFALSSLTSFIGTPVDNDYEADVQLDFYLPHEIGGLIVCLRWQEKRRTNG